MDFTGYYDPGRKLFKHHLWHRLQDTMDVDDVSPSSGDGPSTRGHDNETDASLTARLIRTTLPEESESFHSVTERWRERAAQTKGLGRVMQRWCQGENQTIQDLEGLAPFVFRHKCVHTLEKMCSSPLCQAVTDVITRSESFLNYQDRYATAVAEHMDAVTTHMNYVEDLNRSKNQWKQKRSGDRNGTTLALWRKLVAEAASGVRKATRMVVEVGNGFCLAADLVSCAPHNFLIGIFTPSSGLRPYIRKSSRKLSRTLAPFTMTDGTAPLPFYAPDNPPDVHHPAFDFTIVAYVQAPLLIHRENDPPTSLNQRKTDDEAYRRSVSPTSWNRFTILGYQATTGKDFDNHWKNRYSDPFRFHRMVWYNYMYYIDRGFDIHEKLHFWATDVAQPFLLKYSPESLDMDTERFSWSTVIAHLEKHADKTLWKQVGKNNRSPRRKSPTPVATNNSQLRDQVQASGTRFNTATLEGLGANAMSDTKTPNPNVPVLHSMTTTDTNDDTNSASDAKQSAFTMSNEVTTNDGTQRIVFKWKMSKSEYNQLTQNRTHLLSEIHSLLGLVFSNPDGHFYRWENEDPGQGCCIQDLSVADVKEFLAPDISTIPAVNMVVFAVRFGFTENPVAWKNTETVKEALQLNNIQIRMSNVKTTAGKLKVAGYILLKHPSMTHRHKYLQYLRRQLPEATPYFDIWYHRVTPTDQKIGHLAVYCGEKQVTSLCQALSTFLTGKQTAVFLPRYTFAQMTTEQIKGHFELHEKYLKSLHQIQLPPMATALDLMRTEYCADGKMIERTTREWALSLVLPDGTTHAKCDIVNGGKDKKTYLLVPAAYAAIIKPMVLQYKEKLQPVATREAKYRDSIPDFPDVIHITSNVQSNLDYMTKLSTADIWSKAPSSIKSPPHAAAAAAAASNQPASGLTTSNDNNTTWPSLVKRPRPTAAATIGLTTDPRQPPPKSNVKRQMRGKSSQISITSLEDDGREDTASTHSLTTTLRSIPTSRLAELESEMRECRDMLLSTNSTAKDSADRLAKTELHLANTMATLNDLTRNVTGLQSSFNDLTRTLESMRLTLHTIASNQSMAMISHPTMQSYPIEHQLATIPESSRQIDSSDDGGSVSSNGSTYRKSPDKKKKRSYNREDTSTDETKLDEDGDFAMELFPDENDTRTSSRSENVDGTQNAATSDPISQQHNQTPSPPDAQYNPQRDPAGREDK